MNIGYRSIFVARDVPGRIWDAAELLSDGIDFVDHVGHVLAVEDDSMEFLAAGLDVEV